MIIAFVYHNLAEIRPIKVIKVLLNAKLFKSEL